jgi:hypothetical protein
LKRYRDTTLQALVCHPHGTSFIIFFPQPYWLLLFLPASSLNCFLNLIQAVVPLL